MSPKALARLASRMQAFDSVPPELRDMAEFRKMMNDINAEPGDYVSNVMRVCAETLRLRSAK